MVSIRRAVAYGLILWIVAFIIAFAIFPIRQNWRALFESIMPVVIAAATATLALRYWKDVRGRHVREGTLLGLLWMAINVVIDLPLMVFGGPMEMSLTEYAGDIGLTYVLIPVVTIAVGAAHARGQSREVERPEP